MTAPILFAIEEFPQLLAVVQQGFDEPENVEIVSLYDFFALTQLYKLI